MVCLMLMSLVLASTPPSPGAERLVRTAAALESSSPAPLRQHVQARAWIALANTALGGDPPEGPPQAALPSTTLIADWALACVDAASTFPPNAKATASAEAQVEEVAHLLMLADPSEAARTLVRGGELALAGGNLEKAKELAMRAGARVEWAQNPLGSGTGSLATLLAALGECEMLKRLGNDVPAQSRALVAAAAATDPRCAEVFESLLRDPESHFDSRENAGRLLHELRLVASAPVAEALLRFTPSIVETPALNLLLAQTLLAGGQIEKGMVLIGGEEGIRQLTTSDRARTLLARAIGLARAGELAAARAEIPKIGGIDRRFFAAVQIDSRLLDRGEITAAEVLHEFTTFRAVRTVALDPLLATVAPRPTRLDRVMEAVVSSGRFDLAATLLKPLFKAPGQTGDDWLEFRIALLARSLAAADKDNLAAWGATIEATTQLTRIDSQAKALAAIAVCWQSAHPHDDLPAELRKTLQSAIESIALAPEQ